MTNWEIVITGEDEIWYIYGNRAKIARRLGKPYQVGGNGDFSFFKEENITVHRRVEVKNNQPISTLYLFSKSEAKLYSLGTVPYSMARDVHYEMGVEILSHNRYLP